MQQDTPVDLQLLCPPASSDDCMRIVELLWHKGEPWVGDIHRRMSAAMPGARDYYFIARHHDTPVGHVWYTVLEQAPQLGLIGHIYTAPSHRRRGVSAQLFDAAMTDFRQRGGRTMQLFTSTPYTLVFYERFGFEILYSNQAYHETDWYMCAPAGSHEELVAALQSMHGDIRPLSAGELPQYCLLYNLEHATVSKDRAQPIGQGLEAELAFIQIQQKLAAQKAVSFALGDDQLLAGVATLSQLDSPHQSHIGILDVYTDHRFTAHAAELIDACLEHHAALGIEFIYAMAVDADKCRQFERLGFQPAAALPRHFRVGKRHHDLHVYRTEVLDQ